MTRRIFIAGFVATFSDRKASDVIAQIEKDGKDYNKTYDALIKRVKYIRPEGDAVTCGLLRRMAELNHKIGEGFTKLADIYGEK